jgi:hypothetical protein
MHREVCLKHRKNRRETHQRAPTQFELAMVFVLFCRQRRGHHGPRRISGSSFKSRMPERHSGDAGATPADRANFQKSTTETHNTAGASLRSENSKSSHARGSTGTPCHFSRSRGSQVGRQRPHKPPTSGFDHGPLDHSGGHSPRKRERPARMRTPSNAERLLRSGRSRNARCKAVAVHHFDASSGHE